VGPITPAAAFVHPCRPIVAAKPPTGPGWAHELKHSGYRLQIHVCDGRMRLYTMNGQIGRNATPYCRECCEDGWGRNHPGRGRLDRFPKCIRKPPLVVVEITPCAQYRFIRLSTTARHWPKVQFATEHLRLDSQMSTDGDMEA